MTDVFSKMSKIRKEFFQLEEEEFREAEEDFFSSKNEKGQLVDYEKLSDELFSISMVDEFFNIPQLSEKSSKLNAVKVLKEECKDWSSRQETTEFLLKKQEHDYRGDSLVDYVVRLEKENKELKDVANKNKEQVFSKKVQKIILGILVVLIVILFFL